VYIFCAKLWFIIITILLNVWVFLKRIICYYQSRICHRCLRVYVHIIFFFIITGSKISIFHTIVFIIRIFTYISIVIRFKYFIRMSKSILFVYVSYLVWGLLRLLYLLNLVTRTKYFIKLIHLFCLILYISFKIRCISCSSTIFITKLYIY